MSAKTEFDFSVVIVTYNNENEIALCLDSLAFELNDFSFQIIVIDNNSSDHTKEVVKKKFIQFQKKGGELLLIENTSNLGFTKAINQGLKKCKGQYILTLNPDTELNKGSLSMLKEALQENSNIGVVAPQLLYPDGTIQPSCRRFPRHRDVFFEMTGLSYLFPKSRELSSWKMGDFDHRSTRQVDQPQGACLLFTDKVLNSVGYLDESFPMFFSDVDWCRRVKNQKWEILFEPQAKVIHRQGASVFQKRSKMIWSSHHSFYKYFKKHSAKYYFLNEILGGILFISAVIRFFWSYITCSVAKLKTL